MDAGTALRMHEGYPSCWFLEVDACGKEHVLQKNNSITVIRNQYQALKEQWVGGRDVYVIEE